MRSRTTWLAGVVLGALDGFLLFEFPTLGLVLVAGAILLFAWQRQAATGLGGLLIGIGGMWVGVLLRARLSCDAFNAVSGQSCAMPSVDGYLAAGAVVLLTGLALTALVVRRRRRR